MRHILGFSGSLRSGSYNTKLLRLAKESVGRRGMFEIVDISEVPLYNEDVRQVGLPRSVVELRTRIKECDGLVFATPEYNQSIPGPLKNMIDWVSRPPDQPFQGKVAAILGGGGGSGTKNSQQHLKQVARALRMRVIESPETLISRVWDKWDQDTLLDESVLTAVSELMEEFLKILE